jgi:hypothetical protein
MAYVSFQGESAMAPSAPLKRGRMHLRLDDKTKRKLERAAAYEETALRISYWRML